MCQQCVTDARNFGEVIPGLVLMQATRDSPHGWRVGSYGLVRSNDPDVIWDATPIPDPTNGLSDEALNLLLDDNAFAWSREADKFMQACKEQLTLTDALRIGMLCMEAGYTLNDGLLEYWLFHRMGLLLTSSTPINGFQGEYRWLSNFHPSPIVLTEYGEERVYYSVEHAYQALKATNLEDHERIRTASTPALAKKLGQSVQIREGWDRDKDAVMLRCLRLKFAPGSVVGGKLLGTGDADLIEGNTWGDSYWGQVQRGGVWVGKNMLGRLLMQVRAEIRRSSEAKSE